MGEGGGEAEGGGCRPRTAVGTEGEWWMGREGMG